MELVRRRSLASPRSASICFTPFRAFPLLTSRDEVGIFRNNTMFLLISRWLQYLNPGSDHSPQRMLLTNGLRTFIIMKSRWSV
jgi:hypothetical protein